MELLENNIVSINGLDFKGFSFARIPYDCDFAIVQKRGEKCYRILNCKGHFSKPIKRIERRRRGGSPLLAAIRGGMTSSAFPLLHRPSLILATTSQD